MLTKFKSCSMSNSVFVICNLQMKYVDAILNVIHNEYIKCLHVITV